MKRRLLYLWKERKWQLLFLMYILLLVPTVSFIAENIPTGTLLLGVAISVTLLIVIFILSSFMSTKWLRLFHSVLFAFALIPSMVILGYLVTTDVLLSNVSISTLFETHTEEATEFITYMINPWIACGVSLYILLPILMIIKMKTVKFNRVKEHKRVFFVSLVMLLLLLGLKPVAQRIYFVDFYRVFADCKKRNFQEEKSITARQSDTFNVYPSVVNQPQNLVFVIGESLGRNHMSLYGYPRNTNPRLSEMKSDLFVYKDLISPQVHTIPVLRMMLTFANNEDQSALTKKPSMFELFNRAGYETYLISNQHFDGSSSSYEVFLKQAMHTKDLSRSNKPDGVLLDELKANLEQKTKGPKLIVLHLMGNHVHYKQRYPASFEYFNQKRDPIVSDKKFITPAAKEVIDQYDNSVMYNDYVIASIIELLKEQDEPAAMLYLSDHGEEVYDVRDFAGHVYEKPSTFMCEVPFIVWMSDSLKANRSDLVFDVNRPYSSIDMLYSLSDIAGLRYEGYDGVRSVFSPEFTPRERKIGDIPYEQLQEMTEKAIKQETIEYWALLKEKLSLHIRKK